MKSIKIDPDYAGAYYDIAYTYSFKEQYDKALEYTIVGITKQTDEIALSDLYNMKGTILQAKSDYEGAKIAYKKALE
ncbi:MAG: tetratricopeptide repeat protein, partial [Peptostreptococcaceae bacterium]|nr:tetratricopeptide repeat protein [Peptostreptococcaceae bacterium]